MTPKLLSKKNPFAPREYGRLEKITDRVFLFRNITNSSFVVGDRSVAVIDTQVNRPSAQRVLAAVRSVTGKPIRHVVNTHYHWDHTNGNQLFKDLGATVVASDLTRKFMTDRKERQKAFLAGRGFELGHDPLLPEVTFTGEHAIDLGNVTLRLFFAGRAETDDATAVFVPEERVIMSGDTVMTGSFPIFGQPVWDEGLEGSQWIQTLEALMHLKPKHILPGHGPLAHEPEIEKLVAIERFFLEEVGALVKKGHDLNRVLADIEPRLPRWITEMPIVWGTPRYAILRVFRGLTKKAADKEPGWQSFKPSAIPQADEKKISKALRDKKSLDDFLEMARESKEGGDAALKVAVLKKAAEIFPASCDAWAAYADALIEASKEEASVLEKGDFFEIARRSWNKALEIDPNHAPTLLGKGRYLTMMAYRGGDDPHEGMALLEQALVKASNARQRAEAEFYLGMGRRRLGDEVGAHLQFKKSIQEDPAFMPAHLAMQA